jgi:hypothetical protein
MMRNLLYRMLSIPLSNFLSCHSCQRYAMGLPQALTIVYSLIMFDAQLV